MNKMIPHGEETCIERLVSKTLQNLEYDMKQAVCQINLKALLRLLEGFLKSFINCIASY